MFDPYIGCKKAQLDRLPVVIKGVIFKEKNKYQLPPVEQKGFFLAGGGKSHKCFFTLIPFPVIAGLVKFEIFIMSV